jgi:hypothetical protein
MKFMKKALVAAAFATAALSASAQEQFFPACPTASVRMQRGAPASSAA